MRIEGDDHGLASERAGPFRHMPHYFLVGAMHSVEIAHADHGWTKLRRHFIKTAEYLHGWLSAATG